MIEIPSFDKAVTMVLRHEGKLANLRNDKGDLTNFGVSLRFLKNAVLDINNDGEINELDIKAINADKAKEIYKTYWWDKYHYDRIQNQDLATRLLDLTINVGAYQAHKLIQRACNDFNHPTPNLGLPLITDGIIGPKSLLAINTLIDNNYAKTLLGGLKDEAANFYVSLVTRNRLMRPYLAGWLNRLND